MGIAPAAPPAFPAAPASNRPNTFPAKYLGSEKVLLETAPLRLPALILVFGILILFGAVGVLVYPESPLFAAGAVAFGFVFALPGIARYISLGRTHYAMTDRRILILTGVMSKTNVSVNHDQITTIEVREPWLMGLLFGIGTIRFSVPSFAASTLAWLNVAVPQETLNYILQAKSLIQQHYAFGGYLAQASMIGSAVASSIAASKSCWNCRSTIRSTARFCPSCGARQP